MDPLSFDIKFKRILMKTNDFIYILIQKVVMDIRILG